MTFVSTAVAMLAVFLLPEGTVYTVDRVSPTQAAAAAAEKPREQEKSARIEARRTDLDRNEGVMMFEDDVFVEYLTDYTLNADRLFAFFKGTNALSRIVASGSVAFTNETRTGSCDLAVFRNSERRIELYGGAEKPAKLADRSGASAEVVGSKITFWIDTEQVEVIAPVITVEEKNVR